MRIAHISTLLLAATLAADAGPRRSEILWDTYGVPHIFAKSSQGAFYAFGWAQAKSHGNLLLRLYGQARARGAEYWGKEWTAEDRWLRAVGLPRLAAAWWTAQSAPMRANLEAFAAGVNDYARTHGDQLAPEVKAVLPIRPEDLLAHTIRAIHFTFVTSRQAVEYQAKARAAPGSNAWAIAPKRAEGGKAMLLANPHLPWRDLHLWYEAHLNTPGVRIYGATLVGIPWLAVGFNERLGWTHTVNTFDGADLYELTLAEGGYRFEGKVRPFEAEEQAIRVRQPDGSMTEEKFTVRRSVHGPVVSEKDGKALALRVVGLDQPHMFEQYWDMARARNLKEFEAAFSRLQIPMFTVMYADRDGHIMHVFGGRVPVRGRGDWRYWLGVVPGDTSETLWTRTHAYAELPRVLDPPSGWLQNANDPPWTTTFPLALDPARFPPYMAPQGMAFRPQRSARMLDEDSRISFDELLAYKHSTRMEMADRIMPELLDAARRSGSATALKAAEVLAAWDRCADAESRGAVLFEAFVMAWARGVPFSKLFAKSWEVADPRATPRGIADPKAAVAALERAHDEVTKRYGDPGVAWGQVHRFRGGTIDLPGNGAGGFAGVFRVIDYGPPDGSGRRTPRSGDSFVAAVEFSTPVRARVLVSYGNSSQPGSKHQWDQLELLSRKQLRTALLARKAIEAHLEEREEF